jgi:predicted Zn-dependent peptidase
MSRLGRAELALSEFADLDEALRRVARVTVDDVQALAADLAGRPFSLVAVGPVEQTAFRSVVDASEPRTDVA